MERDLESYEHLFRLLSRLWLRECDSEVLRTLSQPAVSRAWTDLGGVVPDQTVDELAVEYCRLFIGPGEHLSLLQSVWAAGQLNDEPAISMQRFVELLNYPVPEGIMIDHLGIQFGVMAHLIHRKRNSHEPVIDEVLAEFFSRHVTWPGPLCDQVQRRAPLGFYASVATVTQEFLRFWQSERLVGDEPD